MSLLVFGINYKSAPLFIREKVSYDKFKVKVIINSIMKNKFSTGVVIICTCNRTEMYFSNAKIYSIIKLLNNIYGLKFKEIKKYIYVYTEIHMINHLFNVVCGLDSMILGETQIFGQIKFFYNLSNELKCLDKVLDRLFQYAFYISKHIRSNTDICFNSTSIAKIAVQLADYISDIKNSTILVLGAGENSKIILKYLIKKGIKKLIISNRTSSNVLDMLNDINFDFKIDIEFISIKMLFDDIIDIDLVITSTGSNCPIITKSKIENFIKKKDYNFLYMIDIAVPRDIEQSVSVLKNVYLYCIDDLEIIIKKNYKLKFFSSKKSKIFIKNSVFIFFNWINIQKSLYFLLNFRNKFYNISNDVLLYGLNMIKNKYDSIEVIKYVVYSLTNKLLHIPTIQIKKSIILKDKFFLKIINNLFNII
ncbi:MAG TPA: glutamyl-tRNA reductase [Candidatus Azosocius sp. HAIN]|mgnify:CR=1 FL=1